MRHDVSIQTTQSQQNPNRLIPAAPSEAPLVLSWISTPNYY